MATLAGTRRESPPGTEQRVALLRVGAALDLGRREDQEDALGVVQPGDGAGRIARRGGPADFATRL